MKRRIALCLQFNKLSRDNKKLTRDNKKLTRDNKKLIRDNDIK